jgi:predicted TPR repeat methyltransferase
MAKTDDDALAEAYNRALSLEKSGDFDLAAAAYARCWRLIPTITAALRCGWPR